MGPVGGLQDSCTELQMSDARARFLDALKSAVSECRKVGYVPKRFIYMINTTDPFDVVRSLIHAPSVSEGFTTLWEKKRLDLSCEAIILKPEWREHFSPQEIAIARKRLAELHYVPPWDSETPTVAGGTSVASEGPSNSGSTNAKKEVASAILPPIPDAEQFLQHIRSIAPLAERNHEAAVQDLLLRLGYGPSEIVFQRGRIDVCIRDHKDRVIAVFEVKRTIGTDSERLAARRQGIDYATQSDARWVILSDGDRYEIYDRDAGGSFEKMARGSFRLTMFKESDRTVLDLLRPEQMRG